VSRVEGFNDITISPESVRRIAATIEHMKKALQSLPLAAVSDDALMINYADALRSARAQIESAAGVLEHLLQRAATCN
jgi:hypothetical protein